jgi:serine/threonine protein kinase
VAGGGIVTIYSVEQDGDIRFLTMEQVEGQSLDQVIPRGGQPSSHGASARHFLVHQRAHSNRSG